MTLTTTFQGTREQLEAYAKSMNATLVAAEETAPRYWSCLIMGTHRPPEEVTLTHERGDQFITVLLRQGGGQWNVVEAVDEEGNPALLTPKEKVDLCLRAERGEDETGR